MDPVKQAEIGCWLHADFHGNGYATEALKEIIRHGFTVMNLQCIYGDIYPDNKPVSRMLEKLGFENQGGYEVTDLKTGKLITNHRYVIIS